MLRLPDMRQVPILSPAPPPHSRSRRAARYAASLLVLCLLLVLAAVSPAPALEGAINLNTATAAELKKLPFIGKARAEAILRYRKEHNGIRDVEELKAAADIGEDTLTAIRPYVFAETGQTPSAQKDGNTAGAPTPFAGLAAAPAIRVGTNSGDVRVLADDAYFATLIPAIREAKHSIRMAMFLFKTSAFPDNRPFQVEKELIAARNRGVEVEVVLEKSERDEDLNRNNAQVLRNLKKAGIAARTDAGEKTTHAKIVVIDSRLSFVGSHNMTHAALAQNHEMTLLIDSESLARELERYIRGL